MPIIFDIAPTCCILLVHSLNFKTIKNADQCELDIKLSRSDSATISINAISVTETSEEINDECLEEQEADAVNTTTSTLMRSHHTYYSSDKLTEDKEVVLSRSQNDLRLLF